MTFNSDSSLRETVIFQAGNTATISIARDVQPTVEAATARQLRSWNLSLLMALLFFSCAVAA